MSNGSVRTERHLESVDAIFGRFERGVLAVPDTSTVNEVADRRTMIRLLEGCASWLHSTSPIIIWRAGHRPEAPSLKNIGPVELKRNANTTLWLLSPSHDLLTIFGLCKALPSDRTCPDWHVHYQPHSGGFRHVYDHDWEPCRIGREDDEVHVGSFLNSRLFLDWMDKYRGEGWPGERSKEETERVRIGLGIVTRAQRVNTAILGIKRDVIDIEADTFEQAYEVLTRMKQIDPNLDIAHLANWRP